MYVEEKIFMSTGENFKIKFKKKINKHHLYIFFTFIGSFKISSSLKNSQKQAPNCGPFYSLTHTLCSSYKLTNSIFTNLAHKYLFYKRSWFSQ